MAMSPNTGAAETGHRPVRPVTTVTETLSPAVPGVRSRTAGQMRPRTTPWNLLPVPERLEDVGTRTGLASSQDSWRGVHEGSAGRLWCCATLGI